MIGLQVSLLALLAAGSITLAIVEAAFSTLKRRRLGHVAADDPRAELANRYLDDPPALLIPLHLGTYTAHVGMTGILTWMLLDVLGDWAVVAAVVSMLIFLLLFRLTLPYAIVKASPDHSLLFLLPAVHIYARLLSPLARALRQEGEDESDAKLPPGVPPPPVHEADEARLVDSLERFSKTQAREVMTPRPDIEAIAADADVPELRRMIRESKYSRIPVYGENLDDMVGIVTVRDLIEHEGDPGACVRDLAHPVFLVPESKRVSELLKELQARQVTLAVVIDEYGGTAGVLSVEDIVEEIVGEIKDEYDVETEPITVDEDGSLLVAGRVSLDRLEQYLGASLLEGTEVETVGGLATEVFGHVPQAGERAEHRGFRIVVVDAERKRVNRLRIRKLEEVETS